MDEAPVLELLDARSEFHDRRAEGIGATDSSKILGLSRWGSALSVFYDKVDRKPPGQMSLPAWLGLKLQGTVAELYSTATGIKVRADNRQHIHPDHGWMVCHLDYRGWGRPKLLVECKTRSRMDGFGEDGSGIVPVDIWIQCQHEMAVVGAEECHVAVLFGLHTYRTYVIVRDQNFIDSLIPRLSTFWHDNVLRRIPPLAMAGDDGLLRDQYPVNDGTIRSATPEQELLLRRLVVAKQDLAAAQKAHDEVENRIKQVIGAADGLRGATGTFTWKKSKDGTSVGWELVSVALRRLVEDIVARHPEVVQESLPGDPTAALDALVSLHSQARPGSRRSHWSPKKEVA